MGTCADDVNWSEWSAASQGKLILSLSLPDTNQREIILHEPNLYTMYTDPLSPLSETTATDTFGTKVTRLR